MAVAPQPNPNLAVWGRRYSPDALPSELPEFSELVNVYAGSTLFLPVYMLQALDPSKLPVITIEVATAHVPQGLIDQYLHGIVEYASRGLKARTPGNWYPSDWRWIPHSYLTGSGPAYTMDISDSGQALLNLVAPGGGGDFFKVADAITQAGVVVVFAIAGAETIGAAVAADGAAAGAADEAVLTGSEVAGDVTGTVDGSVTGAVDGAGGVVDTTTTTVAGDVGGAVAGAGAVAGDTSNTTTTGVDSIIGDVGGTTSGTVGDVLGGLGDTLSGIKDSIEGIIGPIADTVHSISDTIKDINENLIKPIVAPITAILDGYKTLTTELARDLHSGVTGLLRIPQDIGTALNTIDATMQRTVAALGAANEDVIRRNLGPGVGSGVSSGLDHAAVGLNDGLDKYNGSEFDPQIKHLNDDATIEDIAALEAKVLGWSDKEFPLVGKIGAWAVDGLLSLSLILDYLESKRELYRHIGRQKFPAELLEVADVMQALRRGILPEDLADVELSKHGLGADRIKVLKELDRVLPSPGDALEWRARGIIDEDAMHQILSAQGWRDDDQQRLLNAHRTLLDPATVLRMLRRGFIDREEAQTILTAHDFRFADIERLEKDSFAQPGPGDVLAYEDRLPTINAQIAPQSLAADPPDSVLSDLRAVGVEDKAARLLWFNHFNLLSPELAAQAWFRGYISETMRNALYSAAAIAPEQWQNFTDLQRPVFTLRNVPQLIKAGIITPDQGRDYLKQAGYSDIDAEHIVELTIGKEKVAGSANAGELHGLTSSIVLQLFDAGTIDRNHASSLLSAMGMGEQAVDLTLTLRELTREAGERKAETDLVLAQAKSGHLTFEDAQAQLHSIGLTTPEVERALTQLNRDLAARTKMPSEAQLLDMYMHALLSRVETAAALALLGYSDSWAELLIQLKEAGKGTHATPGSTGSGA